MFDWDDLRISIAVADAGSTLAAARALGVSQTTVARRIAALETSLGLSLFERRQGGYAPTPVGEGLLDAARDVSMAAGRFADAAAAATRDAGGIVRVTTLEIYAVTILPPILRDLHAVHPGIRIELDMSEVPRDLAGGAADIALRNAAAMSGAGVVGRKIAPDPWTLYCSRAFADEHGVPRTRDELSRHPMIGGGGEKVWRLYRAWLQRHDLEDQVAMHQGSVVGLLAAVRSGIGLAVLPSFVADRDPDLIRCLPPRNEDPATLWLLTHERLRHVPRIRVVLDFLGDRLGRLARA